MNNSGILLEICVDDAAGLAAAIEGGADRIELCSALDLGGLTPSKGLMALAATAPVPVYALIRSRPGDFVYSAAELDVMMHDIETAREAGLAGVVLGAAGADGALDTGALQKLVRAARGLGTTLHRVFDLAPDKAEAIEAAVELGFERILTSGGAPTAAEGADMIEAALAIAAGRISIMPGGGINSVTVGALLPRLGAAEIHASCSAQRKDLDQKLVRLGFSPAELRQTSQAEVAALKSRIAALE
jgi:copper homeostasis protein